MLLAQQHAAVVSEDRLDVLGSVFAAEANQHASADLLQHELLQRPARRIDEHSCRTVFAANPAPKRVVAIESDDFLWRAAESKHSSRKHGAHGGEKFWCVRNVSQLVGVFVLELRDRVML